VCVGEVSLAEDILRAVNAEELNSLRNKLSLSQEQQQKWNAGLRKILHDVNKAKVS